jgi:ectoine hydroxylase
MSLLAEQTWTPMTAEERAQFDRDGFLVIPAVLTEDEVAIARTAILRSKEKVALRAVSGRPARCTSCRR